MNPNDERDAIDRLYERMESIEPPADLTARIMLRIQESQASSWQRWQQLAFAVGYVAALLALALLSYLTGVQFEHSHLRELLSLVFQDISAVKESPDVYITAVREAVPWTHLLAVLGDALLLAVATRFLLKVATPHGANSMKAAL